MVKAKSKGVVDDILVFLGLRKRQEVIRREPLRDADQIMIEEEYLELIWFSIKSNSPGTPLRWDKMLRLANRLIEPSEDKPDPPRLDIDMETYELILRKIYQNTTSGSSEALSLMREFMPNFYDKHSIERAKKVSHFERNKMFMTDESYSYAEIDYEVFATIYAKVVRAFGAPNNGFFCDLGSGVGQLVFTAALVGSFKKVGGVENVNSLHERGSKRMVKWEMANARLPAEKLEIEFMWAKEDFFENTRTWYDATFIFLHWTAFSNTQVKQLSNLMNQCKEGCIVVSLTRPVENDGFKELIKDRCKTSYGDTFFYVQEKVTTAKERAEVDFMNF
jgi:hypothetical protein